PAVDPFSLRAARAEGLAGPGGPRPSLRHRPRPSHRTSLLWHETQGCPASGAGPPRRPAHHGRANQYARPEHARRTARASEASPRPRPGCPVLLARPERGGARLRPRRHPSARPPRPPPADGRPAPRPPPPRPL